MPPAAGHHRRLARAGGGGAVRDAAARRSRRARDQDRAARRRRLRARLRHDRQRPVELLRLAESIEGIADARSEAARRRRRSWRGCSRAPTCSSRTSRPARPIGSALAPADLRARYPRLIVCTVSGYGTSGPYAQKKAYDLLVQSEVGLLSLTGTPRRPAKVGISVADIAAGMYAYSGILTALLARATHRPRRHRRRVAVRRARRVDGRAGVLHRATAARAAAHGAASRVDRAVRPFVTATAVAIYLAIQNAREWTRFCADVLGRPELADDARFATNSARVAHRADAARTSIAGVFARAVGRRDHRAARTRRHRLRAHELGGRIRRASAAGGARPLARVDSPAGPLRALRRRCRSTASSR